MIRATDLASPSSWVRPTVAPVASDGLDAAHWFGADELRAGAAISGDLSPPARGLQPEQHAQRVLSFLQEHAA